MPSLYTRAIRKAKRVILGIESDIKGDEELAYWNKCKEKEGDLTNDHYEPFYTEAFELAPTFYAGKRLLDIGCGPRGSLEWADQTMERVGLDPLADKYLKLGASKHKMTYLNAPSEAMPFADGHFDVIASFNSIDHVDDLDQTIREITRCLKQNGLFLLMVDIHRVPTICEPQTTDWNIVDRFKGAFTMLQEKHFEKSSNGAYASITEAKLFNHDDPTERYGILHAKLQKN